VDTINTIRL